VRKIRDILRLKAQGLTVRQLAVSAGPARSTIITGCLHRAEAAGVSWALGAVFVIVDQWCGEGATTEHAGADEVPERRARMYG